MYICLLDVFLHSSTIFHLVFRTVRTVCYLLFFVLFLTGSIHFEITRIVLNIGEFGKKFQWQLQLGGGTKLAELC